MRYMRINEGFNVCVRPSTAEVRGLQRLRYWRALYGEINVWVVWVEECGEIHAWVQVSGESKYGVTIMEK